MNDDLIAKANELAHAHWNGYVAHLLAAHGIPAEVSDACAFHYQSAFVHGFKHGVEQAQMLVTTNEPSDPAA